LDYSKTTMQKILSVNPATKLSKTLRLEGKRIVLAGGCFDILHLGHVLFLEKAKRYGDILFVWVESDLSVTKRKGEDRPIHTQKERVRMLAALEAVDYVIVLPHLRTHREFDQVGKKIKPAIIATTKGDVNRAHKLRSAKAIGAKLLYVINQIPNKSSSRLAQVLLKED